MCMSAEPAVAGGVVRVLVAVGCAVVGVCSRGGGAADTPTPTPLPPAGDTAPRGYFRVRVRAGRGLMGWVWLRVVVPVVLTAPVASVWLTEPQGIHCVDTLQRV